MQRRILPSIIFALFLLVPVHAQPREQDNPQQVLLEIGEEKIITTDFFLYLKQINPLMDFAKLPTSEQRRWLDEFVEKKLFALRAREVRLDQVPEVRARIQFFTDGVLAQAFEDKVLREIVVTEEELADYYRTHREEFKLAAQVLLQHFLSRSPEKAARAQAQLQQGASLSQLAEQKKADSDVLLVERAWFTPSLLIRELAEVAFQLPVGEVSDVIHSSYGYHVIRVEAHEPTRYQEFAAARPEILDKVRQMKATRLYQQILDETKRTHQIRIHLDRLQR